MKALIGVLMGMALALPAAAGAEDSVVGRWKIQGSDGTCSASTTFPGDFLLMVFSRPPGGENEGGLMIGNPVSWKVVDGPTHIELVGTGAIKGKRDVHGYAELSGYWLAFADASEMGRYPDEWRLKAMKDGALLIDQPVTQFKAAVAALAVCAAKKG